MTAIERTIRTSERLASDAIVALLEGASLALAATEPGDDDALPRSIATRLARDAASATTLYESLADTPGIHEAFRNVAIIAADGGGRILAIAQLVDRLVDQAEAIGGSRAGRGEYKRQQVKAALLYGARRGGYAIPLVPSFLEPLIFSIGADVLIDFTVAQVNAHDLWRPVPARATLQARIVAPPLLAIRAVLQRASKLLAGLSWSLILAANRLSPALRATVDRIVVRDDAAIRALTGLRAFVAAHPRFVTDLAALFAIATRQTEALAGLTGPQKQAYARRLILIVLRQQGLIGRSPLLDRIVGTVVTIGIDATVALFNRRGLFVAGR